MVNLRKSRLIEIEWPEFGAGERPPGISVQELRARIESARARMEQSKLSHLIVYGDREHFANLAYLVGFDPRYEEALAVLSMEGKPLLLVGNEGEGYLPVSALYTSNELRAERFQAFSLLNQPRADSRLIKDVLASEGIEKGSRVGCVGWKYFSDSEHPDSLHAIDVPSYLADTLRDLAGRDNVINATDIFMHPDHGLRTACSPAELAYFEFTSVLASEGMKRMILGMQEGMLDYDVVRLAGYNGEPLSCHISFVTEQNRDCSLSGPIGALIRRGDPLAANIAYWGSNCCRAGWIAHSEKDLPPAARSYVSDFAGPYFSVIAEWFRKCRIGVQGGELYRLIQENLPFAKYRIFLNPGHLIHLDEWVSSPIYPESEARLHSGMVIQVDVIPSSDAFFSTRVEDGIILADRALRQQIEKQYPDCFKRCQRRKEFMAGVLGFELPEELLPLSNIPGIVPPYLLNPKRIIALQ
jgi:Xaa-Pro aminopeptidase